MSLASRRAAHPYCGRVPWSSGPWPAAVPAKCLEGFSGICIDRSALQLLRADNGVDDALFSETFRGGHRYI